jgi:asparagine synthase (glutamine-hydrolysing)
MGAICAVLGEPGDPELAERLDRMLARSPYRGEAQRHIEGGLAIGIQTLGWDASLHSAGNWLVAFHGYIGNWDELAPAHSLDLPADADNAHRIVIAYEALGDDLFVKLRGEFALLILDRRRHELVAVRDILGSRPLFTTHSSGRTYLASEIRQILSGAELSPRLNLDIMLDHLIRHPRPTVATLYQDVSRILPAEVHKASIPGTCPFTRRPYWTPPHEGHNPVETVGEAAEQLREILMRAVSRSLPNRPFTATLTGGVDSNAVWAVIREMARYGDRRAQSGRPISLVFPGDGYDESDVIRASLDGHGMDGIVIDASGRAVLDSIINGARSIDAPLGWALDEYQVASEASVHDGRHIMLTGYGGDEWLWMDTRYLFDLLRHGHGVRFVSEILRLGSTTRRRAGLLWSGAIRPTLGTVSRMVGRAPQPPRWIRPEWRKEARLRLRSQHGARDAGPAARAREIRLYFLDLWRGGSFGELDEQASAFFGVEDRSPLNDLDVIEFGFGTRQRLFTSGHRYKHLFRLAVDDLIPQTVRDSFSKAGFTTERFSAGRELGESEDFSVWVLVESGLLDAQEVDRLVHTAKLGHESLYERILYLVECEYFARYLSER